MGKLRKLRKAIEKKPEAWFYKSGYNFGYGRQSGLFPHSAYWWNKKTPPRPKGIYGGRRPYRAYVRHVLRQLGYPVVK